MPRESGQNPLPCDFASHPGRHALVAAAAARHSDGEALSVAARALAKHAPRGGAFWGACAGPVAAKNAAAADAVARVLADGAWCNVHALPGDAVVFEARELGGYGARWACDYDGDAVRPAACAFRGFLEPRAADGHDRSWTRGDADDDAEWDLGPEDLDAPYETWDGTRWVRLGVT